MFRKLWVPAVILIFTLCMGLPSGAAERVVAGAGARAGESVADLPDAAHKLVKEGIAVELEIVPVNEDLRGSRQLIEDEDVTLRFRISDSATGATLSGLGPAVWIDPRAARQDLQRDGGKPVSCDDKIKWFLQGSLALQPAIDLNTYYILTMNEKPTISVIDPVLGFFNSKLITHILLKSPGEDWALTGDGKKLFVSMPKVKQVAVAGTEDWKVIANLDAGINPIRVALQPDERYLWVGNDASEADEDAGGVTVIDPEGMKVVSQIATAHGHHELAFSDDNRYVFVSNQEAGSVSVIDVLSLKKLADIKTGQAPVALAYSMLAKALYVADERDGVITVVDGKTHQVLTRISARPGLRSLRFTPDGRWAVVVNHKENVVHIIDSSVNRILHNISVDAGPDQVSFTSAFAYIRASGSDQVNAIQLSLLGKDQSIPAVRFPAGQIFPDKSPHASHADAIVPTPEGDVVLVANPMDKTVYYYMEGMLAPMGNFQNYGNVPRAVLVVDRSLRETAPGVYSSTVKLPGAGVYDVAFLIDNPLVHHCFEMDVRPNSQAAENHALPMHIEFLTGEKTIGVGEATHLLFKVTDPRTNHYLSDLRDIRVYYYLVPGLRQKRVWAKPLGDGLYEAEISAPQAGLYYVHFECASLGVSYSAMPYLALYAAPGKE